MNYFYDVLPKDLQIYINQISNILKIQEQFKKIKTKNVTVNKIAINLVDIMPHDFLELNVKNIENIIMQLQFIIKSCKNNFIKLTKSTSIKLLCKIITALEMEEYVFCHTNCIILICKAETLFMELLQKTYNLKKIGLSNIVLIDEKILAQIDTDIPDEIVEREFLSNIIISNAIIESRY